MRKKEIDEIVLRPKHSEGGEGGGEALLPENCGNRIHIIAIGGSKVSLGFKTKPLDKMTSGTKTGKEGSKIKTIL